MSIARFMHISEDNYRQASSAWQDAMPCEAIPLPKRATAGSAGYDFVAPVPVSLQPGESATIPTGIRAMIDQGWVLMIFPRSGLGFKFGIRLANTVGVIDSDYFHADNEGHIMVRITNGGDKPFSLQQGDRFCQGVFLPYGTADETEVLQDRTGGFGSTGK